ncbi:MAG: hypothetical protein IAB19_04670 [Proteobacteria bacterium]|uniref:Permuted papain-like amidase enzyme, YaeF/YiiX, C92 family n=1 Tax=Candidatus Avisuccinivibrio stercorigallinarum TaxID=2840704 RepID=A0A9D9GPJ9_9GAMM|nr:hypothetical protein [Candidatus Avisuccinivibrio stercorigallinarum]
MKLKLLCSVGAVLCAAVLLPSDSRPHLTGLMPDALSSCPQLAVGDIVLRQGMGADSVVIAQVSGGSYSHVGMVARVEPEVVVIHAATTDLPDPRRHNQVIASTLPDFAAKAVRLAVKRYQLADNERGEIALYLESMLGEPFVLDGRKGSLYCSTLVQRALSPYLPLDGIDYNYVEMPVFSGWYLFPEQFMLDRRSRLIFKTAAQNR